MTSRRLPPVRAGDEAVSGKERSQWRMPEKFWEATPEDGDHVAEEAEPDHSPGAMAAIDFERCWRGRSAFLVQVTLLEEAERHKGPSRPCARPLIMCV